MNMFFIMLHPPVEEQYFEVSPDSLTFAAEGGTETLEVQSSTDWQAE